MTFIHSLSSYGELLQPLDLACGMNECHSFIAHIKQLYVLIYVTLNSILSIYSQFPISYMMLHKHYIVV